MIMKKCLNLLVSRSYITNSLSLTLPQKFNVEEKITSGHAKILVGLDNAEFCEKYLIKNYRRQAEKL